MQFSYRLPVNLLFGRGRVEALGVQTALLGRRAFIVTGKGSTRKTGLLAEALKLLDGAGVETVLFEGVEPNPLTTTAQQAAQKARRHGCDVVVAIGGGSAIDAAKGIALLAQNEGDINDYIFNRDTPRGALPLVAVPTTCGTGSEGNGFAVLTNPETGDKKSLRSPVILPAVSIVDPQLMRTLPKAVLASVGFDALCHNMEAYLSQNAQPMTTIMALEGMRLAAQALPRVYENADDLEAWDELAFGSALGGMCIGIAGVTAAHGAEHPASGRRDIVHGRGLAALMPVVVEESIEGAPAPFAVIARLLGGKDERDAAPCLRALLARIGLSTSLGQEGVREDDVDWMVANAFKVSAASLAGHPVKVDAAWLERVYRRAL